MADGQVNAIESIDNVQGPERPAIDGLVELEVDGSHVMPTLGPSLRLGAAGRPGALAPERQWPLELLPRQMRCTRFWLTLRSSSLIHR